MAHVWPKWLRKIRCVGDPTLQGPCLTCVQSGYITPAVPVVPKSGRLICGQSGDISPVHLEEPSFPLAKFLPYFMNNGLLEFVRGVGHMGNPRVVFSRSHVLQGLRHECYGARIGLEIFCHLRTMSLVVRHPVYKQVMELFRMKGREESAETGCFNIINYIDSWWCLCFCRSTRTMHLFIARDKVPLRHTILGFDLNVVQNYYNGSSLFCAFQTPFSPNGCRGSMAQ